MERVLPREPRTTLAAYAAAGGGRGLRAARRLGPAAVIDEVAASGLRGRGGAGFPTGRKWRTVAAFASAEIPTTVVVNGAEGEPGSFKDRALLRTNPCAVVEGALVAALAVGADRVVVALKEDFTLERARVEAAIEEVVDAGWAEGVALGVVAGPREYLFGEETALLEVLDGRPPFPRIAPPFRHGVDDLGPDPAEPAGSLLAERGPGGAPPTLVNNVETLAHVPGILAEGADWFRAVGTASSPGTFVCTVSGATRRAGVAEVPGGTPLADVVDRVGGGLPPGRRIAGVLSGVAHPILPPHLLATPLTHEDMDRAGSGLGACGFLVFDDTTDLVAVAAGVARFLSVESCGQCTPCKQDGRAIAAILARACAGDPRPGDATDLPGLVVTVTDEARCFLAHQQQRVVGSILQAFPDLVRARLDPDRPAPPVDPMPVVPIADISPDGRVRLADDELRKQPDWTYDATDSGQAPADRLASHPQPHG